jgi:integrase
MNDVLTTTLKVVRMNTPEDSLVFYSRKGTPYRSFRSAFELAVRKAGLDNFTFHDLRHTFASRLVMAGVDLPTVKELMGHKDITMTLRYTHLSSDHKQRAVRALERGGEQVPAIFTTDRARDAAVLP